MSEPQRIVLRMRSRWDPRLYWPPWWWRRRVEPLRSMNDLLTPEQQAQLTGDLREMAARRRRAQDEAGGISLP